MSENEAVPSEGLIVVDNVNWSSPDGPQSLAETAVALLRSNFRVAVAGLAPEMEDTFLAALQAASELHAGPRHANAANPGWLARNRLLAALLIVVLVVMSEPAYARLLPPEVHAFLAQEEGPAAFCMALVAAVTAAMAVNNSRGGKD